MTTKYIIKLAENQSEIDQVNKLLVKMYEWRGYKVSEFSPFSISNKSHKTIIFTIDKIVMATLSIRIDSGEGLSIEKTFPESISDFRKNNRKVCEIIRFAVDDSIISRSLPIALFQLVYLTALSEGVTDFLIEVNPRHTAFYKKYLHFKSIDDDTNDSIGAPSSLLHNKLCDIPFDTAYREVLIGNESIDIQFPELSNNQLHILRNIMCFDDPDGFIF